MDPRTKVLVAFGETDKHHGETMSYMNQNTTTNGPWQQGFADNCCFQGITGYLGMLHWPQQTACSYVLTLPHRSVHQRDCQSGAATQVTVWLPMTANGKTDSSGSLQPNPVIAQPQNRYPHIPPFPPTWNWFCSICAPNCEYFGAFWPKIT